ncbi:MAG: hypothetical protein K9G58_13315 [Bacteroidales bacterium]|nr:hypothetical protein [Bacteroidales bacterium]MCF8387569.1 hypothetical protein [Bacteroidales bacterium]MCF8399149.1 hypothetical protein [Bacteroidales bacterium]
MKRTFSIGLAFLMVLSTIGITIHKHYSHGELYSVALFGNADPCCEMDCGCCYEESETYRLTEEFITSSYELDKVLSTNAILKHSEIITGDHIVMQQKKAFLEKDKSPPGKNICQEFSQAFLL